jgi:hypothetical protein
MCSHCTLTSLRFSSSPPTQITQTLSPFEQEIVAPLFENFPYKLWDKYGRRWVKDIGPALLACYGGMKWADWKYEELVRECWD